MPPPEDNVHQKIQKLQAKRQQWTEKANAVSGEINTLETLVTQQIGTIAVTANESATVLQQTNSRIRLTPEEAKALAWWIRKNVGRSRRTRLE